MKTNPLKSKAKALVQKLEQERAGRTLMMNTAVKTQSTTPVVMASEPALQADPGFFGSIAAQLPEMFAGACFDGDRLIAPCRAAARVDPARILQHVRLRPRALHLRRLTVL
jgi:hypothetical protein